MNRAERSKMMGQEKIPILLKNLAVPAIIGMLVTAIYNVVDTLFVSMLGTEAIGAVSVVYPMFMLLSAVGLMYGIGSASFVSRLLGKNEQGKADTVASTTVVSSVLTAVVVTIVLTVFLRPVLSLFGATPDILDQTVAYGRILVFGGIFTINNMTLNNLLRAEGSAKFSMIALLTGAILNIVLDPLLIFTFDMGVSGAALATVLSQAISSVILFSFFIRRKSIIHLSLQNFKPSRSLYSELYKIGLPTFIRQFLMSVSMALLNTAASPYGAAALASLGIVTKVFSIAAMVVFGFSQAFQPVAGFNYGAGYMGRLKETIKISLLWSTIFTSVSTFVYYVFASQIVGVFSNDPQVLDISIRALRAMVVFLPLFGFQVIYGTLFQALGKGKQAAILSLSRQGIFFIPAVLILPEILGLNGVLYAQPLADICTIVLTAIFAKTIHKEINTMEKLESVA